MDLDTWNICCGAPDAVPTVRLNISVVRMVRAGLLVYGFTRLFRHLTPMIDSLVRRRLLIAWFAAGTLFAYWHLKLSILMLLRTPSREGPFTLATNRSECILESASGRDPVRHHRELLYHACDNHPPTSVVTHSQDCLQSLPYKRRWPMVGLGVGTDRSPRGSRHLSLNMSLSSIVFLAVVAVGLALSIGVMGRVPRTPWCAKTPPGIRSVLRLRGSSHPVVSKGIQRWRGSDKSLQLTFGGPELVLRSRKSAGAG